MFVNPQIFREYDIRGIFNEDLTSEIAKKIGLSAGTYFQQNRVKTVVVGHDNRLSWPDIFEPLVMGLQESGCRVIDLGYCLSPFVYFSWYDLDANASIMVTASHNPAKFNGFKMSLNKTVIHGNETQKIKDIFLNDQYLNGKGERTKYDIFPHYLKKIKADIHLDRPLKAVVDCGNGTAGMFAPKILKELGVEVIPIFCQSDGSFPHHDPYPQKKELYQKLSQDIVKNKADIGLAYDGDGDRLGVYDEKGNFLENDRLAMVFAKEVLKANPGRKMVMNITTSLSVLEYIKSCGGEPMLWRTGFPNISEKMKETDAILGGEISGHFFFRDRYLGYDDAIYASLRLLEIISKIKDYFSQMIASLPRYFETREIRIEVPSTLDKFTIMKNIAGELKKEFSPETILDLDGVRFSFPEGWGLIRASNTESVISVRAEAKNEKRLAEIKSIIEDKLRKNKLNIIWGD
ncbi:phosphomannomutase [Candidatus Shapirobacteria bacterium CG03_land_8_20_14_0_80_39_12]|uniref:Phosphomannomutase n=1 Tax=Candidatus Shapirobacteria bacterium CG03_land_8_20_14_0_80_39_12 TaxID=1974879 RepID=A0A2M7BBN2_9BACT|nr:MAG: phosphomannomutase [Candidatus Shapirobacteria bacterium CG03_land_8_20_14_0_80_39_12]